MAQAKYIVTPLSDETLKSLQMGDVVYISGDIYTARDAAHKRLMTMIESGEDPPLAFSGQVVYYAGPCPNKPGHIIGSVGPTTSGRMDGYTPTLIAQGLKAMIGKGLRSAPVVDAIVAHGGVYFAAIGGAGALLAQCVQQSELVAFPDLATEAIYKLHVENFPVVVAIDARGQNIYTRNNKL